ncbi:MAG: hypothetical protein ACLR1K_00090 [Oscillospiraceae bacterium]
MNTFETILGILAFAVVIAVLYVWGLKKSYTQSADLERILLSKSAGKVVNHLKKNEEITLFPDGPALHRRKGRSVLVPAKSDGTKFQDLCPQISPIHGGTAAAEEGLQSTATA